MTRLAFDTVRLARVGPWDWPPSVRALCDELGQRLQDANEQEGATLAECRAVLAELCAVYCGDDHRAMLDAVSAAQHRWYHDVHGMPCSCEEPEDDAS